MERIVFQLPSVGRTVFDGGSIFVSKHIICFNIAEKNVVQSCTGPWDTIVPWDDGFSRCFIDRSGLSI